jgi:F-type H+-transporting ATPase subunit a
MFPSLLAEAENPLNHAVDHAIYMTKDGVWLLSNHVVMLLLAFVVCLVIFIPLTWKYRSGKIVPTGTQNAFEAILLYLRNDVAKPLLGEYTDFYMPLLWTLFFFVWVVNLLGLIPMDLITKPLGHALGLAPAHGEYHGIFGTATGNVYTTGTLAMITFIVVQATGILRNGLGGWAKHFLGGAPIWLAPLMVLVEIMGMLIKPFSLAIRLFANMTAGHVLLAVVISFTATVGAAFGFLGSIGIGFIVIPAGVALMLLELFVATLQAYLFMFLSALFISQMLPHHDHDHDSHAHEHATGNDTAAGHIANTPNELAQPAAQRTGPAH